MDFKDDIVAISTPSGMGAISVIRLTGDSPLKKVEPFFKSKKGTSLSNIKSHSLLYGDFMYNDEIIDEVVLSYYAKDKSFTGQETIEISCHGSTYIQKIIIEKLLENNIRLAKPGEFTMRAFLNGKFDLTQAEAVSDLIYSDSASMHKIALNQMRGGFQNDLKSLREELLHFTSMIELELDFSEEDVEFANKKELVALIERVKLKIQDLKNSFKYGNAIKNGVPVAIAGKPNSGKSSLLNLLLNEDKAIVSNIPGTTRDAIEDILILDGIKFRFVDTAGLRNTDDEIEAKGIEITKSKISKASVLIYLFDINNSSESEILEDLSEFNRDDLSIILVRNKIDLKNESTLKLESILKKCDSKIKEVLEISAIQKKYVDVIKEKLLDINKLLKSEQTIVTNLRHFDSLSNAESSLVEIEKGIQNGLSGDLLSIDLRSAIESIGEITGQITNDEMLGNIFSNFCIGK
ncbi:MAG: tRNA uridine-5-carboxymethylaminomethyl(34) synthesis GTPase MnmE [Flavobacteriales bacterium]|nr:tRNA uridine-5-carboxymethylaminomethyl(34) synthesis GTPase MnmE [Flavobacteriales bacterium]